jgi:tRNA(adenine34) deaminase
MRKGAARSSLVSGDERFMRMALGEAERAAREGEVPVGAVVVSVGKVVARAHNRPIHLHDPSAHAEILALRRAAKKLGNYRLEGCDLYVTIEPCAMCAGAIVQARLRRTVFGTKDPKAGACGSILNVLRHPRLNHQPEVVSGVLADDCAALLREFFRGRRQTAGRTRSGRSRPGV